MELLNSTIGFPILPFFVVIMITPFAPREPYIAVAEASFRISIDSTSSGAGGVLPGKPSTTYRGSELALMEVPPRTRTRGARPGSPLILDTDTPGARPCNACAVPANGKALIFSDPTEETEPVKSLFFWVPYPITTTCSISVSVETKLTFTLLCPRNGTSCVVKPTIVKTNVAFWLSTRTLNSPLALVVVPDPATPFTVTETP